MQPPQVSPGVMTILRFSSLISVELKCRSWQQSLVHFISFGHGRHRGRRFGLGNLIYFLRLGFSASMVVFIGKIATMNISFLQIIVQRSTTKRRKGKIAATSSRRRYSLTFKKESLVMMMKIGNHLVFSISTGFCITRKTMMRMLGYTIKSESENEE